MASICDGNMEALGLLFRRYARLVRGVAYRVLRDAAEADDLVQDIFLLVQRLCRRFDSRKSPARSWILQMTYRRAPSRRRYLACRHFYKYLELEQAEQRVGVPPGTGEHIEELLNSAVDNAAALQSWLADLSDSQRLTLQLFFFEGCTFEEIATQLGQTVGNARNHYYRGLDKLRKQVFWHGMAGR